MFRIKDVIEKDDGSAEIDFESKEDFELFKTMAKKKYGRKRYSDTLGSKYFSHILMQGIKLMKKDNE